ncbi:anaerobic sulfatase maturase [Thaumasiovibrio sp. DFM-14]|uniref:anaerobic sulfatase maturase n=1 Tax=Thaumasiovibrio sp. DFM-14 TaxID=3384792 RepID=UPI0039A11995
MSQQHPVRPSHCHVMAKPSSSVCNLDCSYCFYLEKEHLYPERKQAWRMSDETLDVYIRQHIEAQDGVDVEFAWQGGEPTLMGVDFFRRVVELQEKYRGRHNIHNAFQTNGILLNDEWCEFFKAHHFLVGISIDGPAELHDCYRVNRAGKPTHAKVMAGISLLKKHGVEFNTLTVVNHENAQHPEKVYAFLTSIGSCFLQFIPLVERETAQETEDGLHLVCPDSALEAKVTPWSVSPAAYGDFLCRIFDVWVKQDVGRVYVNMFDSTLASWCGHPAGTCIFSETCGHLFALESNGDLYNCDHYVYPEHLLGNIHEQSIRDLNQTEMAITFGQNKRDKLTKQCESCPYRFACHGGCPKHRFITSRNGEPAHNYFCAGYEHFFKHTASSMQLMRDLLQHGRPAAEIMTYLHRQTAMVKQRAGTIGRNEPCPCNSGKKFKRCCGK